MFGSIRLYLVLLILIPSLIVPLFLDEFLLTILVQMLMWAYLAMAWDVIGGYGGQFSLGHAAFLGLGAYTSTLLLENFGVSPWLGILASGLVAGVAGAFVGFASLRLRGPFFALGTIAFAELTQLLLTYLKDITGGPLGIMINKTGFEYMLFEKQLHYYYLALAFVIFGVLFLRYFERSKFGMALVALREDEDAAEAIGVNVYRSKVLGATISAFLTGLGGTLYAQWIHYIRPDTIVRLDFSVQMAAIDVVGGAGSPYGGIIGALILVPISLYLNALLGGMVAGLSTVLYGIILLVVVVTMPGGIFGILRRRFLARG